MSRFGLRLLPATFLLGAACASTAAQAATATPVAPSAVRTCRDVASLPQEAMDEIPRQVDGMTLHGAGALRRLRSEHGQALVIVRKGDFSGADLRGADLRDICFVEAKLAGTDWRGVRARGIGFLWSDLTGARLAGASMPRAVFVGPYLDRVDASGADLSNGLVTGNDFGGWNGLRLDGADLRGLRFDCPSVTGASCAGSWGKVSFRRADLRGAWIDSFWGEADWTDARLGGTRVNLLKLPELGRARIDGSLIVYERPAAVTLTPADYAWLRRHVAERGAMAEGAGDRSRAAGARRWIRPGARALFVAAPIAFDAAAQRSPLYRRLMPAILAGPGSHLRVHVRGDGSLDARGRAIGGNAHRCTLGPARLRLARSGWYSAAPRPADPGAQRAPVPLLRFRGERAEVYGGGHPDGDQVLRSGFSSLASCGARAAFEEMVRVPFPVPGASRRRAPGAGEASGKHR